MAVMAPGCRVLILFEDGYSWQPRILLGRASKEAYRDVYSVGFPADAQIENLWDCLTPDLDAYPHILQAEFLADMVFIDGQTRLAQQTLRGHRLPAAGDVCKCGWQPTPLQYQEAVEACRQYHQRRGTAASRGPTLPDRMVVGAGSLPCAGVGAEPWRIIASTRDNVLKGEVGDLPCSFYVQCGPLALATIEGVDVAVSSLKATDSVAVEIDVCALAADALKKRRRINDESRLAGSASTSGV